MYCNSHEISKKHPWQRVCNMHANVSKLLNFSQLKKKNQFKETQLKQQNSGSHVLNQCSKMSAWPTEVTKSIVSHTRSLLQFCTPLIHSGVDSLGVAFFFTAHWAGLMWPTVSETLWICAGSWRPKRQFTEQPKHQTKGVGEELWLH